MRKKLYIEMLEEKVDMLEKKNKELRGALNSKEFEDRNKQQENQVVATPSTGFEPLPEKGVQQEFFEFLQTLKKTHSDRDILKSFAEFKVASSEAGFGQQKETRCPGGCWHLPQET